MTLVAFLGVMTAAAVMTPADSARVDVSYADLNLASPAGRAALEMRVTRAARRVCGAAAATDLRAAMAARKCVTVAQSTARPQIDLALARTQNVVRVAIR